MNKRVIGIKYNKLLLLLKILYIIKLSKLLLLFF